LNNERSTPIGKTLVDDHAEHEHEEDDIDGEIVITIEPREGELDALGISLEEFEAALAATLDAYDRMVEAAGDPDEITALDDAEIILGGKGYPLSAVADINIASDPDSHEDQDEDDDPDMPED
jgi:hypothetical protein